MLGRYEASWCWAGHGLWGRGEPAWPWLNQDQQVYAPVGHRQVPQFWNVLKGEMRLVGPLRECPELIRNFKDEIARYYNARLTVKPGTIGWAQVINLRGDTTLTERMRHDLYYVEHWSLFFDLRTMFLTL